MCVGQDEISIKICYAKHNLRLVFVVEEKVVEQ